MDELQKLRIKNGPPHDKRPEDTRRKDQMDAPQDGFYTDDRTQEALIALRGLLSRNQCASHFGPETLSELLYAEGNLSRRMDAFEVEYALEALRVEGEVLA